MSASRENKLAGPLWPRTQHCCLFVAAVRDTISGGGQGGKSRPASIVTSLSPSLPSLQGPKDGVILMLGIWVILSTTSCPHPRISPGKRYSTDAIELPVCAAIQSKRHSSCELWELSFLCSHSSLSLGMAFGSIATSGDSNTDEGFASAVSTMSTLLLSVSLFCLCGCIIDIFSVPAHYHHHYQYVVEGSLQTSLCTE